MDIRIPQQTKGFYGNYWKYVVDRGEIDLSKARDVFKMYNIRQEDIQGKRVLDLGCGAGAISYVLATGFSCRLDSADYDPICVEVTRKLLEKHGVVAPRCFRLDATDAAEVPDNTYDTVISIGVLHHTGKALQGMKEIHRILKEGGVVYLSLGRITFLSWLDKLYRELYDRMPPLVKKAMFYTAVFGCWICYLFAPGQKRFSSCKAAVADLLNVQYHQFETDETWMSMMRQAGFGEVETVAHHSLFHSQGVYRGVAVKR